MAELQNEFNWYGTKIKSGTISHFQMAEYNTEMNKLKDKIGRFKDKYDEIMNKELEVNKPVLSISKHVFVEELDYIWIIFRNNETTGVVQKLYEGEHPVSIIFRKIFCITKEDDGKQKYEGNDVILEPQELEPDQIIWQNLKYTQREQKGRKIVVFVVSILMAVLSIVSTLYFEGVDMINSKYAVECEGVDTSTKYVFMKQEEFMLKKKIQNGEDAKLELSPQMMCFCNEQTNGGMQFYLASQEMFLKYAQLDKRGKKVKVPNFCWSFVKLMIEKEGASLLQQFAVVILNEIISTVFVYMGELQMMHTTIEQTLSSFMYIVFLEYFNMAIIILIKNFDFTGVAMKIMQQTPETADVYAGFSANWYYEQGSGLCLAIFVSALISNFGELKELAKINFKRFMDRDRKFNVKKDIEDDGDDEVNSKQLTQDELNDLYTGSEFNGEESFSRMISIMMVCISYSSGMPIMYFVGFTFFFTTFVTNKILLITHMQKTTYLSRVTPNYSLRFLNIAIFLHMCFGCVMFTNPSLFESSKEPKYKLPNLLNHVDQEHLEKVPPAM